MIRESLNTNAANAFIGVTPGNGVTWQYRSSTGGGTVGIAGGLNGALLGHARCGAGTRQPAIAPRTA